MAIIDDNTVFAYVSEMMKKGVDAIDAILTYAHDNSIEPEVIGDIARNNLNLLALIEESAESMNLIEKRSRLQFD